MDCYDKSIKRYDELSPWCLGSGRKDVFAVGGSAILHYNGCTWTSMTNGETPYLINVWGSSETDVYAVGQYGTLLFYNGNKWSSIQSGTANDLFDIWGTSGREIFAWVIMQYSALFSK